MKKLFLIGLKDVKVAFRDRAALILMLLAPFLLTLGLGAVTGRFSGRSSNGISHIPVILINQDQQELGQDLIFVFQSPELDELIDANVYNDTAAADRLVDENKAVAVILIPEGFTASIIPPEGQMITGPVKQIELYTNPTAPTSVGVVKTILDEFMSQVEVGRAGGTVTVTQLITSGRLTPQQAQAIAAGAGADQANSASHSSSIRLNNVTSTGEEVKFDVLALLAPSMAMMFLMYTVTYGGRSILAERAQGTLPRLLVTPISTGQVLGGKVSGIFLTGLAQMVILILFSAVAFGVRWGSPVALIGLIVATVFAASGWGALIAAYAKSPGQAMTIGSMMALVFAGLAGNFVPRQNYPEFLQKLSLITPNAWALEGFQSLGQGGGLQAMLLPIVALTVMGVILFVAATVLFRRQYR